MVMSRVLAPWVFLVSLLFNWSAYAVIYGSESAVFVFPTVTFPAVDANNTMLGFGWFKNGILLENSSTTCVFNCGQPVSGYVNLNGGTLQLQQDLVLSSTCVIAGGGTIIGNDHTIWMSPDSQFESAQSFTLQDVTLKLSEDFNLGCTLTFDGACELSGDKSSFWLDDAWTGSGAGIILVAPNSWLYIDDISLQNIAGTNVACMDDTGIITLSDMQWLQSGAYVFGSGALNFYKSVSMAGTTTFVYQSGMISTIMLDSTLIMDSGFTFSYDPTDVASQNLLAFDDVSSTLELNGATLHTTVTGLTLKTGTLQVSADSYLEAEGYGTVGGITFGDGTFLTSDLTVIIVAGVSLRMTGNTLHYTNLNNNSIHLQNASSSLFINTNTKLELQQSLNLGNGMAVFAAGALLSYYPGKVLTGSVQPLGTLMFV